MLRSLGQKGMQLSGFRSALQHQKHSVISGANARRGKHYFLYYDYVPDILERRDPFREEHIAAAKALVKTGDLVFGGPQMEPVDSAVFLFDTESSDLIEKFVKGDPYYQNGLVTGYRIREFNMVVKDE